MDELEKISVTSESRLFPNGKLYDRLVKGDYGCKTSVIRDVIKGSVDECVDSVFYKLCRIGLATRVRTFMRVSDNYGYGPVGVEFDASAKSAFSAAKKAAAVANGKS